MKHPTLTSDVHKQLPRQQVQTFLEANAKGYWDTSEACWFDFIWFDEFRKQMFGSRFPEGREVEFGKTPWTCVFLQKGIWLKVADVLYDILSLSLSLQSTRCTGQPAEVAWRLPGAVEQLNSISMQHAGTIFACGLCFKQELVLLIELCQKDVQHIGKITQGQDIHERWMVRNARTRSREWTSLLRFPPRMQLGCLDSSLGLQKLGPYVSRKPWSHSDMSDFTDVKCIE